MLPASVIRSRLRPATTTALGQARRVELPWPLIEPQRGVFDWTRADAIVLAAGSHNVQLQPVLVYTPAWSDSGGMTLAPGNGDYAAFVSAVVGRYHTTIHYWEL